MATSLSVQHATWQSLRYLMEENNPLPPVQDRRLPWRCFLWSVPSSLLPPLSAFLNFLNTNPYIPNTTNTMTNWTFQIFAAASFVVFLSEKACKVPAMALLLIVIDKNLNAVEQPQQESESNIAVRTPKENWKQFYEVDEVDAIFQNVIDRMDTAETQQ
ncbi:hypothetical protein EDC01DRAFT_233490 [Geopyxis carbonaria]|nr:hypothetical protein EDC01DRAFT_233490 [Geopyxis carbonaria]